MRYWHNGEDEDYEREVERVLRFRGSLPSPMSRPEEICIVLLVGVQTVLFACLIVLALLGLKR